MMDTNYHFYTPMGEKCATIFHFDVLDGDFRIGRMQ